ncbi:MFS transporter [Microbacterium sp. KR10-403]|uniref:MFS transporter n=1 Tax=Microbacterium sp. KR10-403 TaxID=3158581 RepID=UPI0032E51497
MSETLTAPIRVKAGTVVGFLVFVELTSGFIQGYYLPLIAAIAGHLQVSDADITWFVTLQSLAAGVSVPILAKLGDIFGHRRMLRIAIACVFAGAVLIAFSPGFTLTLVGRVIQGPLAVWLPLEIALIHSRIKGETARKGVGFLISALTIGALIGGILGGVLGTAISSLTVVLLVPAVVLALCLVIVFTLIPESTTRTSPKIDGVGFTLLALFMLALLFGLRMAQASGFGSALVILLLIVSLVLLIGFIVWELRVKVPAIDLRLIASRALWPIFVTSFVFGMVLFGTQSLITTFLAADPDAAGYGFGFNPGVISLFTAGTALLGAVGAFAFPYLAKPLGIKTVILMGVSFAIIANIVLAAGYAVLPLVVTAFCVNGLGIGLLLGALPALIAELAPSDQTGIATGVYNSLRTLGGAVAGAIFGVILTAFTAPGAAVAGVGGYVTVWIVCVALFVVAFLVLLVQRTPVEDATKEVVA